MALTRCDYRHGLGRRNHHLSRSLPNRLSAFMVVVIRPPVRSCKSSGIESKKFSGVSVFVMADTPKTNLKISYNSCSTINARTIAPSARSEIANDLMSAPSTATSQPTKICPANIHKAYVLLYTPRYCCQEDILRMAEDGLNVRYTPKLDSMTIKR